VPEFRQGPDRLGRRSRAGPPTTKKISVDLLPISRACPPGRAHKIRVAPGGHERRLPSTVRNPPETRGHRPSSRTTSSLLDPADPWREAGSPVRPLVPPPGPVISTRANTAVSTGGATSQAPPRDGDYGMDHRSILGARYGHDSNFIPSNDTSKRHGRSVPGRAPPTSVRPLRRSSPQHPANGFISRLHEPGPPVRPDRHRRARPASGEASPCTTNLVRPPPGRITMTTTELHLWGRAVPGHTYKPLTGFRAVGPAGTHPTWTPSGDPRAKTLQGNGCPRILVSTGG